MVKGFSTDIEHVYVTYAQTLLHTGNEQYAALAAGVDTEQVDEFISAAKRHPVVLETLATDASAIPDFEDQQDIKKFVLARLWRESNYKGKGCSHTGRIAALCKLADLTGIVPPKSGGSGDLGTEGGLLLVPVIDPNDWEKQAMESQRKLLEVADM